MPSQRIVRAVVRNPKAGGEPTVRYVPLEIFGLWQFLMEAKHGFELLSDETSLWIDVEESPEVIYNEPRYERVTEVSIFLYSARADMYSRTSRYFPTDSYDRLKAIFLSHYLPGKDPHDPELPIRERPGVWIRKGAV